MRKKAFADMERPTLHFAAVICHGLAELVFLSDANLKKDSNTEQEMISQLFLYMNTHCESTGKAWPEHVSCQADNCWREMRNQYTLFHAILLVLLGVVSTFTFNYLVVGHTHEDVGNST